MQIIKIIIKKLLVWYVPLEVGELWDKKGNGDLIPFSLSV
jgi:hypothetical protein